jgi:hypothetical protein
MDRPALRRLLPAGGGIVRMGYIGKGVHRKRGQYPFAGRMDESVIRWIKKGTDPFSLANHGQALH